MRTCSPWFAYALAVVALACGQQPRTVTLTVTLEGSGVVRSTPVGLDCGSLCAASFAVGTSVTLTAEPAQGFVFGGWGGACSGSGTCVVALSEDRTVSARFTVESRTLTASLIGDGDGTVTSSVGGLSCPGTCLVTQPKGTTVTLTAVAAPTSAFVGWTGGGCSGVGECTLTLTENVTVQVAFALKHSLVVSRMGSGTGIVTSSPPGIDCGADCAESFAPGTEVTLTATPAAGSTFAGWSGACSGSGPCHLVVSSALMATATFTLEQHLLTVTKSGTGSGTVTSTPSGIGCGADCEERFDVGTSVTLAASAATGSRFTGWTGACSGTGTCVVTVTAATSVGASFALERAQVLVTKSGTGSGTVVSSPAGIDCGTDCDEAFDHGTTVTLTATPSSGSTFGGWSGGACSGTGTCTVTVTAAVTLTATFSPEQHLLTVTKAGTGSGTVTSTPAGITCGTDCEERYDAGTSVSLTATAATGSHFGGWTGACSGNGTCVVSLSAASTVGAIFTLDRFLVSVAKSGSGSGQVVSSPAGITCGTDCDEPLDYGTVVTLTATASTNSTFGGWSGPCMGTGACTFTVTGAVSVTAAFSLTTHSVTVLRAGSGSGAVVSSPAGITCGTDCEEPFPAGTHVTLTAQAATGSTFAGWSGGGCTGTGTCVLDVTAPVTVSAVFDLRQYALVVSTTGSGSGSVASNPAGISCGTDCSEAYGHGTVVVLTATPNATSTFAGWSGACTGTGTCSVTLTAATTVTAQFDLDVYTLTVGRAGNGTGTVASSPAGISCGADCSEAYSHGTSITLTATAATGSTFGGWSGGGCSGTGSCVVTLTAATTVTATFTLTTHVLTVSRAGTGTGAVTSNPAGITCGTDCSQAYTYGTSVTLTAASLPGSAFAGWSGGCSGTGTCTVTMTTARTITATFVPRGTLYVVADSTDTLMRADPDTGTITPIGALGVSYAFGDLAWNPVNGILYMVDGRGAQGLYRVNVTTGAATLIGTHGIVDMFALAFSPSTGLLYGIAANALYRLNLTTGAATLIGTTGASASINGLAWDSARGRMVALTANLSGASVYSINLSTGAGTLLASTIAIDNNGWTYDSVADRLTAVDYGGEMYAYDPTTFARTELANGTVARTGVAFVP